MSAAQWTDFTDTPVDGSPRVQTCWTCAHGLGESWQPPEIPAGTPFARRAGKCTDAGGQAHELVVSLHLACSTLKLPDDAAAESAPPAAGESPATDGAPPADEASGEETLTPERKEKLVHYAEIRRRNEEVLAKFFEWESAHAFAAALKKDLESMRKDLNQFIKRGRDPQRPLGFDEGEEEAPDEAIAASAPEWRSRPVSVLGISAALCKALDEAGLGELGPLKDFWDAGKQLASEVKGIGAGKALTIGDAFDEYGTTHPEVYGNAAPPDAPGDDPFAGDEPAAAATPEDEREPAGVGAASAGDDADDDPFVDDPDE